MTIYGSGIGSEEYGAEGADDEGKDENRSVLLVCKKIFTQKNFDLIECSHLNHIFLTYLFSHWLLHANQMRIGIKLGVLSYETNKRNLLWWAISSLTTPSEDFLNKILNRQKKFDKKMNALNHMLWTWISQGLWGFHQWWWWFRLACLVLLMSLFLFLYS